MIKLFKRLFKKKSKYEGLRIRFIKGSFARLAKPPPEGLFHIAVGDNVIVTKECQLAYKSEDKTFIYFLVFNPFLAVKDQAPDRCIVYISHYHFNQLDKTKQFKRL